MAFEHTGIIIGVNTNKNGNIHNEVEELVSLSESIGIEIIGSHVQNRDIRDPRSYIGTGFLEEIREMYESIDYVIVNDEITASQNRTIEKILDTRIIDRTQVILDIFSLRAESRAGKLQVELAQLEYLVPRLSGQGINLSRLGAGIGTRGPGETKLETDRRHIRTRIKEIKKQLAQIENHRLRYREKRRRNEVIKVSLIGYTNAGKSSLFNTMAKSDALEEDALFATLDSKTRQLKLPGGFECILSDTVGFIQNLPTTLIESFKSTLEEAADSDFLIHVIDNDSEHINSHYDTVKGLMAALDMDNIPQLVLFNKSDLNNEQHFITSEVSHLVNKKMESSELLRILESFMKDYFNIYKTKVPAEEAQKLYDLKRRTIVTEEELEGETFYITGHAPEGNWVERIVRSNNDE